uniref:Transmembrane protein n=1 Tax=Kalanchoe fedtschenkoi TaxID=63787 RepID=A0A7N0RJF7_KALFE
MASFSSSQYSDCPTVVGISICTTFICESISWLLIYRTDSYKTLCFSIDRASKKLESMKTTASNPIKKSSKVKKMDRFETTLKESNRDLSLFKFKSGVVVALVLFVVFGLLNSLFEGRPVDKTLKNTRNQPITSLDSILDMQDDIAASIENRISAWTFLPKGNVITC